jgi:hypothetical protein
MQHELALNIGESFVIDHPHQEIDATNNDEYCERVQTVITVNEIHAETGAIDVLMQTWKGDELITSQSITLHMASADEGNTEIQYQYQSVANSRLMRSC